MNHSPAYIISRYLIDQGLVVAPSDSGSWPIFVGCLPDGPETPSNAVGCMDTAPSRDGRIMGGSPFFHYGVQLLLRATDYNTGYSKIASLVSSLDQADSVEVAVDSEGYTIENASQTTGIIPLGQEEGTKRRYLFSANFLVTIKEE